MTTAELLEAWREATRAAELEERLAKLAAQTVDQADLNATSAEEVARMAEDHNSKGRHRVEEDAD